MFKDLKYQFILHLIVLVWGITGILGDYIDLPSINSGFLQSNLGISSKIVFFRTGIALATLLLIGLFIKKGKTLTNKQILKLTLIGGIVGLHWVTFFYAIKISTISIGVVCMSMSTLFTSFLEPIIFKRKLAISEIVISFFILAGILIIFGFEFKYKLGILSGLISAFLAALFTVLNGKLIKDTSSFKITKFEMLGACLVALIVAYFSGEVGNQLFTMTTTDLTMLLILGIICTTVAFMVSVWVMKFVSPFTVSISINMEPIYTIIIAIILVPEKEKMSLGFYIGGLIIIGSIFTNAYLKKRKRQKLKLI
jgi:drug/metabolite transporter (DMT)-like permease